MIHRDRSLFLTLGMLPADVRGAALRTVLAIESDVPDLPGPEDLELVLPPNVRRWRRRVGATAWWVVYSWVPGSGALILRTVNRIE